MIYYRLDYAIEKISENAPTAEQLKLKKLIGTDYTKEEAKYIWGRVIDHKWFVGERLKRDVGLRVAAIDYIENFYNPALFRRNDRRRKPLSRTVSNYIRDYFMVKNKRLPSL